MSINTPKIVHRAEQPYAGIHQNVTMDRLAEVADRIPEVLGWLEARGIGPAGPPFFRYDLIAMESDLSVEVGVPVAEPMTGDDRIRGGVLPAGRYVTAIHVGAPNTLVGAVRDVLQWGSERELRWDMTPTSSGERWACRMESYLTNPQVEPDPTKWATELAFRLAD